MDARALGARLLRALVTRNTPPISGDQLPALATSVVNGVVARDFPAMFTIWAARAAGQPTPLSTDAGACWLGLYLAAKIIDDVQDQEADLLPASTHPATAINLGLALTFAAQLCLADGEGDPQQRLGLLALTNSEALRIVHGQQLGTPGSHPGSDLLARTWLQAGEKAGRPYALAARLGAVSVDAQPETEELLAAFGQQVGEAVQAIDDAMDLVDGKASDLRNVQGSLALSYGFSVADDEDRAELMRLLTRLCAGEQGAGSRMRDRLLAMGAARYLSIEAEVRVMRARSLLAQHSGTLHPEGRQALWRVTELLEEKRGASQDGVA